ncbi:branched-chain amino acid ABC transporter permease [Undibacterium sp. TS12]|uniref:branched-chain amino acid ABC transporter permease n=1 Tax=Undibacterium sp. TS12 TaxID=2908202 RepID=UPI001F4D2B66|nr:branched-chain amino acid ABC transporter permease [Undibacterium sp. TS12]MCH8618884.1 branched-chain amino acid ABC transporter permease [Undibacterium sp. TS12]
MQSNLHHRISPLSCFLTLCLLAIFPVVANYLGQEFYIGLLSRLMIFALVASSLNLILGFGGMVSLGHAAYFGSGAYVVAILMQHGITSAWISWPLAMLTGFALAMLTGSVSLRTKGVYFIMITLAFAQMLYFLFVSLKNYGGDDGLGLAQRSATGLNMADDSVFYYLVLVLVSMLLLVLYRLINSPFGRVVQAIKENETRMQALGYAVFRYKLLCFAIAGSVASLAGALLANQNMLVSPNLLHWTQSGSLMVMVILGGVGYMSGGILGAVFMLMLEEILSGYTMHWQLYLGIILLLVVMLLPKGLASLPEKIMSAIKQKKEQA